MRNVYKVACTILSLVVTLLLASSAAADGLIIIHHPPDVIRPPVPPHRHPFAPLEVTYHRVKVGSKDQVAHTEVDQEFHNPNPQRLEGDYIFPIPKGAQIDKFSMDIDGKMVDGELLDAAKARGIYEDIVRRLRDPALMEYAGQGLFRVRIFPIEPHSNKRIQLKYTELLRRDGTLTAYSYPLNVEKFSAQPLKQVAIKVEVGSREAIKTVYSPSHKVDVNRHGDHRAVVGYEDTNIRPNTDFQLFWGTEPRGELGFNLMTYNDAQDGDGGYFLLLLSPGAWTGDDRVVQKDVVLVLDTSGSMAGEKLEQARRALKFCVANLNHGDRFEVVRFSTEAEAMFGKLQDASQENRRRANVFVDGLKPIGGTAIEDALLLALKPLAGRSEKDRPYMLIFLTDGLPTIGNTDEKTILANVTKAMGESSVRVFSFGIGTDINTHLLDTLAEKTRAISQYVLPSEDIEVKVSSFYSKISSPVLAGLSLEADGPVRLSKLYPAALPDLFRGDQLVVTGRYGGSGSVPISIKGSVNGKDQRITHQGEFAAAGKAVDQSFIPQLWATRRVGYLLDEIRLRGENPELRDEVATLARRYGIVTPYTSYLIVEDEKRRNVPQEMRVMRPEADAAGRGRAQESYRSLMQAKSGSEAVAGAKATEALKRAYAPAPAAQTADGLARVGAAGKMPTDAAARIEREAVERAAAQESRFVQGRTFYRNGDMWVDQRVSELTRAKRVRVPFASSEYFDLLRRHPEAQSWLALGTKVTLLLDSTIYEISD
ncbi:MAG TPA: trypsin [Syntrophobacteraceae bacterium]|nr:trypsin [Syntrophobacteraceae bacterium]